MEPHPHSFWQAALLTLAAFFLVLSPKAAFAAEYWVAPTGSDSAAGTQAAPFATVGRAQTAAAAGDTVFIRGGTYAFTGSGTVGVAFSKSGQANNLIKYFAAPGEIPVFDLTNLTPSNRVTGLDVHCNYVHIRGLEVRGVRQYMSGQDSWGVRIQGNNNVLENLNVHHNQAPGIFITSGSNNRVVNCDSHHNHDTLESGGSGDGFGCHSSGDGNVITGCRGYDNSDDGYDFINAAGSCTVEKSFAFRNGYVPDTTTTAGNGAGFKAGGYGSPPTVPASGAATHTVRQCVAFGNRSQGFYANHHPGRINFHNNTAFRNPVNYNMLADSGYPSSHEIRNNIAMASGTAINNLTGGTDTFNSWNLGVTVSAADFISNVEAEALAARQADGSLSGNGFMRLATGSDLIDKGTNVMLPFNGTAPDLGAFESGASSGGTTGTGGAGGAATTGGASATGGAGGRTNSGGTTGGGGAQARGGAASGGATSTGGANTTGGVNAGGAMASGGTVGTSGGAVTSAGGASSQGGSVGTTGGVAATTGGGSSSTGGSVAAGGSTSTGGSAGTIPPPAETTGCSCRVPAGRQGPSGQSTSLLLLSLVLAGAWRRKRSRRACRSGV